MLFNKSGNTMVHIFSQQKSLKDLSIYGNKASLCACAQGFTEKAQLRQAAGEIPPKLNHHPTPLYIVRGVALSRKCVYNIAYIFLTRGRGLGYTAGAAARGGRHCLHADAAAGAQYQSARPGGRLGRGQCIGAGAGRLCGRFCGGPRRLGARRPAARCRTARAGGRTAGFAAESRGTGPYAGVVPGILSAVCSGMPGRADAQNRRARHAHPLGLLQPAHRHAGVCAAALRDAAGCTGICRGA